jgi:carbamoyl-phosphate synthase large subunit
MTKIDRWFLYKLENIWNFRKQIQTVGTLEKITPTLMRDVKVAGFADKYIATLIGEKDELAVREVRKAMGIVPVVKQIDTLAAEFPAKTNYLYMTYHDKFNDVPAESGSIIVLGSGTYRIGSSVEFDYCAVTAARSLTNLGERTVMINYNPETVSTDYDESYRLYFEELSLERVMDIYDHENPKGINFYFYFCFFFHFSFFPFLSLTYLILIIFRSYCFRRRTRSPKFSTSSSSCWS